MKKKDILERSCVLCEHAQEIMEGTFCICNKKGIVDPGGKCSKFQFDPLKVKVSVRKIPEFHSLSDLAK